MLQKLGLGLTDPLTGPMKTGTMDNQIMMEMNAASCCTLPQADGTMSAAIVTNFPMSAVKWPIFDLLIGSVFKKTVFLLQLVI